MKRKEIRKKLKPMVAQLVADRINPNALLEVAERLRKSDGQILELPIGMVSVDGYFLVVFDEPETRIESRRIPDPMVIDAERAREWHRETGFLKNHLQRIYTDGVHVPVPRADVDMQPGMKIGAPGIPELDGKVITHVHRAK